MVHLVSILSGLVVVPPTMLMIGLKVLSIMPELLTVVAQVSLILMNLSGIGRGSFLPSKLLPVSTKHVFVLPEILTVRPVILCVAREVAVLITQLAMISTKIRLILRYLAPWVSRFRGSLTKFRLGEDGLSWDRSASEHCHRHTQLPDFSVLHARSLSLDRDLLLDVFPILVTITITFWLAVVGDRVRWIGQ